MSEAVQKTPKIPLLLTALTAAFSFLLLLYIHISAQNTLKSYILWVDASTEIKLEVALAHLWFEEIVSGDDQESIEKVFGHLKRATWYTEAMLSGAKSTQGEFSPLQEAELKQDALKLKTLIEQFTIATHLRYEEVDVAIAGSLSDQKFDQLFNDIMAHTGRFEDALRAHINTESDAQNSLVILLFLAICAMTSLSSYATLRFNRKRSRYLGRLAEANQRISEQNIQLQQQAHTDQLTGLPNRKMLETITTKALSSTQRKRSFLALTFIDLDHFKEINDQYGHNVGDKVLTSFTAAINTQLREEDTLARLAGDEFILLLQGDNEEALKHSLDSIIQRINQRLESPIIRSPAEININCSSGTAIAPHDALDFESLLHLADVAMYESKKKGRGQHCYYQQEHDPQSELLLDPA